MVFLNGGKESYLRLWITITHRTPKEYAIAHVPEASISKRRTSKNFLGIMGRGEFSDPCPRIKDGETIPKGGQRCQKRRKRLS
jgi:hypothetical protein